MSSYFPLVVGETSLREDVEGLLDGSHPEAIRGRIDELHHRTLSMGACATFGAEIEFQFVDGDNELDPNVSACADILYGEVVDLLNDGRRYDKEYGKGWILMPGCDEGKVMTNGWRDASNDEQAPDLIEVRTMP